jgi:hypothetical protein
LLGEGEDNTNGYVKRVSDRRSGVLDLMHVLMSLVRNSGDPAFGQPTIRGEAGSGEFKVSPDADGDGKSDRPIVVKKQTNKSTMEHKEESLIVLAETVERRGLKERNSNRQV